MLTALTIAVVVLGVLCIALFAIIYYASKELMQGMKDFWNRF